MKCSSFTFSGPDLPLTTTPWHREHFPLSLHRCHGLKTAQNQTWPPDAGPHPTAAGLHWTSGERPTSPLLDHARRGISACLNQPKFQKHFPSLTILVGKRPARTVHVSYYSYYGGACSWRRADAHCSLLPEQGVPRAAVVQHRVNLTMRNRFGSGQAARSGLYAHLPGDPLCDECEGDYRHAPRCVEIRHVYSEKHPCPRHLNCNN